MSATTQDLASKLARLEHDVQELTARMAHRPNPLPATDLADLVSFRAWLKLSAPTLSLLLVGFTLVWNAQQANHAQLFEMSRTLGRLDGSVAALAMATERFDDRLVAFDERLGAIDERLSGIDERLSGIDGRLDRLDQTLTSLDQNVGRLGAAVEKLVARI